MSTVTEISKTSFPEEVMSAAEEVSRYSLSQLEDQVREITTVVRTPDERNIKIAVVDPVEDSDREHWVIMPLTYANIIKPHMLLRAMVLQRSLGGGNPVVMLPNNSVGNKAYDLNSDQQKTVEGGDLTPILDLQLFALNSVMKGTEAVSGFGYSQGAMTMAQLAPRLNTVNLVSAEAPNAEPNRTSNVLRSDFIKGGNYFNAVADTGLTNLAESVHATGTLRDRVAQVSGFIRYVLGAQSGINRAIHNAMVNSNHEADLTRLIDVIPDINLTIARAEKSRILKANDFEHLLKVFPEARGAVLMGYGHEAGDNILQLSTLAGVALNNAA